MIHPDKVEVHHPGPLENFHPSQHHICEHDGRLKKSWYSNFLCGTLRRARYSCCRRRLGKEGCSKKWACCKQEVSEGSKEKEGCSRRHKCCGADPGLSTLGCTPRYSCCGREVRSEGCRKVCKRC